MQTAWRERNPSARIKAAKEAIVLNVECATAYILLAEEEVIYFFNYIENRWSHGCELSNFL